MLSVWQENILPILNPLQPTSVGVTQVTREGIQLQSITLLTLTVTLNTSLKIGI